MKFLILFATLLVVLVPLDFSLAEPWLANRFAQNCTACHAPGRLNRKASKRRCTLSCQGCHVNPNGGGLRNQYGKWNSERWVRSFYTDLTWNKKSPHPLKKQHYMKKKLSKRKKKLYIKKGARLAGFPAVVKNEAPYEESSNYENAKNKAVEMMRITRDDPYRLERRNPVYAGGDLRFFFLKQDGQRVPDKFKEGTFFPMAFDYGVRVRPLKENLSFVYEGRAFNSSGGESFDNLFAGAAQTRSAYLLVDDLWYNTYAQYGLYRPMFGNYNPNHNAMITSYTGFGINTRVKAMGFGAAPNVPFGIVNLITPTQGASSSDISSEGGLNLTLGLRFVSFGAHLVGSYWSTQNDELATPRKRDMWNINAGGKLGRFIINGEITSVRKEIGRIDETKIVGIDTRYRVWRETYFQVAYAVANAGVAINNPATLGSTQITPGSGSELTLGFKAFTVPGLEIETLYTAKTNSEKGFADTQEDSLQFQVHAYF